MSTTTTDAVQPDLAAVKHRQQQTWASADYAAVAARIVPMAEGFIRTTPETLADKGGVDGFFIALLQRD